MQSHTASPRVVLALIAVLGLGIPATAAPRPAARGTNAAANLTLAGDKLKTDGNIDAALVQYEKALAADPSHVPALQEYGLALYKVGDFENASAQFQKLVELVPDDPVGWYNLGYALRQLEDYDGASAAFRSYIAAHPTDPDGYYALAECLRVLGQHAEAAKQYNLYVEKETREEEQEWIEKARTKSAAMKSAAAAVAARSEPAPTKPRLAPSGALSASVADKPSEQVKEPASPATTQPTQPAQPTVAALSTRDPTGAVNQIREGDRMFQQKRFREALEMYNNAIRLDDQSTNAMLKAGLALANLGQYEDAIQQWERVLELDAGNKYATTYIERAKPRVAGSQVASGPKPLDTAAAQRAVAQSGSVQPTPATTQHQPSAQDVALARNEYRKAVGLINSSQFAEALAPLQIAIERQPDFVNAYVARGGAYLGLRRYNDAAADYHKSLELAPNLATPLYGLGRVYEKLGNKPKAIEYYRRYASSNGPDAQVTLKRRADQAADALSR